MSRGRVSQRERGGYVQGPGIPEGVEWVHIHIDCVSESLILIRESSDAHTHTRVDHRI